MSVAFTIATGLVRPEPATILRQSAFEGRSAYTSRRPARAQLRMQDDAGDDAQDEAPSDTYVPAAEAMKSMLPGAEESKRNALIAKLLQIAAITSRGQLATDSQTSAVDDIVMSLEEINPNPRPVETDLIDGMWTLVYTTSKLFQSNPILMAAVTPLLQLGQIRQKISVDNGTLVTEVDLTAFPLTTGTVKTSARLTPVGAERLELTVETTNVTGGKIADRLDLGGLSFDVPVEQIYSRLRNASPETYIDTYYLDDKLRISRSKQGKLYIYTRLD